MGSTTGQKHGRELFGLGRFGRKIFTGCLIAFLIVGDMGSTTGQKHGRELFGLGRFGRKMFTKHQCLSYNSFQIIWFIKMVSVEAEEQESCIIINLQ